MDLPLGRSLESLPVLSYVTVASTKTSDGCRIKNTPRREINAPHTAMVLLVLKKDLVPELHRSYRDSTSVFSWFSYSTCQPDSWRSNPQTILTAPITKPSRARSN